MKHSKHSNFSSESPRPLRDVRTREELLELQRAMADSIFRPLTARWRMQPYSDDDSRAPASEFIKPNARLTAFERLEIYNRQYWFRLLDCLYDDYPGLRAVLGERKFMKLATAYLAAYPSDSFALRDLGNRLEKFISEEPRWTEPREELALDMARFEWAQVVAFDGPANPPITPDDILDTPPAKLRLGLQPYMSLLELRYNVDEFLTAWKRRNTDGLRREASNAVETLPKAHSPRKRVPLPKRADIYLAVHRHENVLYYKRLESEAFAILSALGRGAPLEDACGDALAASNRTDIDWPDQIKRWFENWTELGWLCLAQQ